MLLLELQVEIPVPLSVVMVPSPVSDPPDSDPEEDTEPRRAVVESVNFESGDGSRTVTPGDTSYGRGSKSARNSRPRSGFEMFSG
jgi:hypothetical protein